MSAPVEEKKRPNPQSGERDAPAKKFFTSPQPQDGHAGVIVSADRGREQRSAKELIDLFEEVAELYFPKTELVNEEDDKPLSLEQELAQELSALKKAKRKASKRFIVLDSGCKNMVFIKFMDDISPTNFLIKVFEYLVQEVKKPRTRYSNRILPLEKTCHVSLDAIVSTITPAVEKVFKTENEPFRPLTFRADIRARYNDKIDKGEAKKTLAELVGRKHFVDLKNPMKVLIVEIFGKAAGVSVVDNKIMELYNGFNIRTVSETFGEPLPPHPDEIGSNQGKKKKKGSNNAETDNKKDGESVKEEKIEEDVEGKDKEGEEIVQAEEEKQNEEPRAPINVVRDADDSDSEDGGISLF